MKCFVTGCAGFIGSNLVDRLLSEGFDVIGYDNFSTGQEQFLTNALGSEKFKLIRADLLDQTILTQAMKGADIVFHLAANADVRYGIEKPRRDLEQNTIVTFNVLDSMRFNGINRIMFSSTGSVYGETQVFPTPEDAPFPIQTSLYGASKLACEGLIQAFCEGFGFQSYIFRFVSILGERYTHGHVFDFFKSLLANPQTLSVLGDGHQKKSYLYIQDCIDGILCALKKSNRKINIFNLGTDEFCEVNDSIQWITSEMGMNPSLIYSGGLRGWIGDNPFIFLDCSKVRSLGWSPKYKIKEGIINTLRYLEENPWLLQVR